VADGACEVWFYHLERSGLDQVLPELLEKTLKRGWKAIVRARSTERLEYLDGWLWRYRDESFLPHAVTGEDDARRQPILLSIDEENSNTADALFLVDGAEPGNLDRFQRCIVIFDGADEDQLRVARSQWSAIKARGLAMSYWRQNATGWEKQA